MNDTSANWLVRRTEEIAIPLDLFPPPPTQGKPEDTDVKPPPAVDYAPKWAAFIEQLIKNPPKPPAQGAPTIDPRY